MLRVLTIRDMVLIETADLEFETGLNVLTGETGAGKSIMLDSLGFVLGWRVRPGIVRTGAAVGEVSAEFFLADTHPARKILEDAGFAVSDTLLLRRTATPEGRRQAWVNDRRATADTLRALAGTLVELHGQQDDRGLLDVRAHRGLLDAFGGLEPRLADVRAAWDLKTGLEQRLALLRDARAKAVDDHDYITHAVDEIDALVLLPDEEPQLDARRRQLRAAEQIREDITRAAEVLGVAGAEGALLQASRWLEGVADKADGAVDPVLDGIARVLAELSEVTGDIDQLQSGLSGDPGELEQTEERLFAIRALARKHNVAADALTGLAEQFRVRLQEIDSTEAEIAELEAEIRTAEKAYDQSAARLSSGRKTAAKKLDARMVEELAPLKLERSVFTTEVSETDPGPDGTNRVRFTAATNPGTPAGPIERVASGGELSRFLLALKVCLSDRSEGLTLIFDEIDRGVGGATADAVGRRLQALGRAAQVLVVTHSPQVAARGVHHWRVGKAVSAEGDTRTEITPLVENERLEEVARMLAGDVITPQARDAARALMTTEGV